MTLTTPALLFPAISLLLLAYTNRFQVLAQLIRNLRKRHIERESDVNLRQLSLLQKRIGYIKYMQALGIFSFILCTFSMFSLFLGYQMAGMFLFGISLLSLVGSLLFALVEVLMSTNALSVELEDLLK